MTLSRIGNSRYAIKHKKQTITPRFRKLSIDCNPVRTSRCHVEIPGNILIENKCLNITDQPNAKESNLSEIFKLSPCAGFLYAQVTIRQHELPKHAAFSPRYRFLFKAVYPGHPPRHNGGAYPIIPLFQSQSILY